MAIIHVSYPHQRSMIEARKAARTFAAKLETKLSVKGVWHGDVLTLERQGVRGSMVLSEGVVDVELTLGMMFTPMKSQIEAEVNKQLDCYLG